MYALQTVHTKKFRNNRIIGIWQQTFLILAHTYVMCLKSSKKYKFDTAFKIVYHKVKFNYLQVLSKVIPNF